MSSAAVNFDAIPAALTHERRWVLWKFETRKGKTTKVPYRATAPTRRAAVDDATTWATFSDARDAYEDGKADGIGFVLGDGWVGFDSDKCIDAQTGVLDDETRALIERLNSYAELSVSRTGAHVLARGSLPAGARRRNGFELYDSARYFVITGWHLDGTPRSIEERTRELRDVHAHLFSDTPTLPQTSTAVMQGLEEMDDEPVRSVAHLSDDELRERMFSASNGAQIRALFDGDTSAYRSASEADMALCLHLAFYTQRDALRIDRLFQQSALLRAKWTRRHGKQTYGELTINKAIAQTFNVFQPRDGSTSDAPTTDADASDVSVDATDLERDAVHMRRTHSAASDVSSFAIVTADDSFVTRYVRYAESRTDAPPQAHELMAVAALSALAGPTPRIPLATTRLLLTFWACYIVNSTVGRKTMVLELVTDILKAVLGERAILEWEGSPQGLVQRLQERDHEASVFVRDEYSGLLQQMNGAGHMAGLPTTFIRAYDGKVLENIRTRKKGTNDSDRVEQPYLTKLTATVWDNFVQRASIDNVLDGFLARFVFVTGAAIPRPIGRETQHMLNEKAALVQRAHAFYERATQTEVIDLDDDVLDAFWQLQQDFTDRAARSERPDAAGPSLIRLTDAVLKTAALLALDAHRACISLDDFSAARTMGERWAQSTLLVIERLGSTQFRRDADALLATIAQRPSGMKLSDVYVRHRQLKKRDFDELLQALETQALIERVPAQQDGRGRPPAIYRVVQR